MMSFDIDAQIENGLPSLRILDADSHAVRLAWRCPAQTVAGTGLERQAVQRLFRELFLLSLLDKLRIADRCNPSAPPPVPAGKPRLVQ